MGCTHRELVIKSFHVFSFGCLSKLLHKQSDTYLFVVINFAALAQASGFRIERRQVVFLCWMQNSKLGSLRHQIASRLNAHSQTGWGKEDQAITWTQQPVPMVSEYSAHLTTLPIGFCTWLWRYTCLLLILKLWHKQTVFELKGDQLSSFAKSLRPQIVSRLNAHSQIDWVIEDQAQI